MRDCCSLQGSLPELCFLFLVAQFVHYLCRNCSFMKGEQLTRVTPLACNLCMSAIPSLSIEEPRRNPSESVHSSPELARTAASIRTPKAPPVCRPAAIWLRQPPRRSL